MIPNETHGTRLFQAATGPRSSYRWMNVADAKRTRTRSDPAPSKLQPLPHHVMDGSGPLAVATDTSGAGKLWKHRAPPLPHIPLAFRRDAQRRGKGEGEICCPGGEGGAGVAKTSCEEV